MLVTLLIESFMPWHSFEPGHQYLVDDIISVLDRDLESGRIKDVKAKSQLLELFAQHRGKSGTFVPFGGGWGLSPYNPNAWKALDNADLIPGYRRPEPEKRFRTRQSP